MKGCQIERGPDGEWELRTWYASLPELLAAICRLEYTPESECCEPLPEGAESELTPDLGHELPPEIEAVAYADADDSTDHLKNGEAFREHGA